MRWRRAASSARLVWYLMVMAAADGFTRPPFTHPVGIHEMRDSFPLGRGRHHFFPNASFSASETKLRAIGLRQERRRLSRACYMTRPIQHSVGWEPPQPRVLVLKRLQALRFRDLHPAELGFLFVDTRVTGAMLPAQIGDRSARLALLHNSDDLPGKRLRFMLWSLGKVRLAVRKWRARKRMPRTIPRPPADAGVRSERGCSSLVFAAGNPAIRGTHFFALDEHHNWLI
jgi:hypothetical protein